MADNRALLVMSTALLVMSTAQAISFTMSQYVCIFNLCAYYDFWRKGRYDMWRSERYDLWRRGRLYKPFNMCAFCLCVRSICVCIMTCGDEAAYTSYSKKPDIPPAPLPS